MCGKTVPGQTRLSSCPAAQENPKRSSRIIPGDSALCLSCRRCFFATAGKSCSPSPQPPVFGLVLARRLTPQPSFLLSSSYLHSQFGHRKWGLSHYHPSFLLDPIQAWLDWAGSSCHLRDRVCSAASFPSIYCLYTSIHNGFIWWGKSLGFYVHLKSLFIFEYK